MSIVNIECLTYYTFVVVISKSPTVFLFVMYILHNNNKPLLYTSPGVTLSGVTLRKAIPKGMIWCNVQF
jgi:hypothetical protein